ncbi:MAG: RNA polymerase sigma factor [Opitutaceae bacterium]
MPDPTDEALMTRVKQGDLDAMAPLFERYQSPLLNFFHRLTGDREASRDLVQAVFERLLRYRQSFRDDGRFRAWIYQTARNALSDHRRRTMRIAGMERPEEENPAADYIDRDWRDRNAARDVREALQQLPESDRDLIVLSRFHGLRYEEIALIMNKSLSAVKTQAHRAVHALRRAYFQEETA